MGRSAISTRFGKYYDLLSRIAILIFLNNVRYIIKVGLNPNEIGFC